MAAKPRTLKVIVVGNAHVGKTSCLLRFANNEFTGNYLSTIAVDFKVKTMDASGEKVKIQAWDTAGQENYRSIATSFLRGSPGSVLVYDITDRSTFEDIDYWVDLIRTKGEPDVRIVLLGNKCDLGDMRAVSKEEGRAAAQKHGIPFIEVSAKDGINVSEAFVTLAEETISALKAAGTWVKKPVGGAGGDGGGGAAADDSNSS